MKLEYPELPALTWLRQDFPRPRVADVATECRTQLAKMLVIGLGKHQQALAVHRRQSRGLIELIPQVARNVIKHGNVLLGVAVVENAYDETMVVRALRPEQIMDTEPALLRMAAENMPSLPVDEFDVLVVDEIGKNISGVGAVPVLVTTIPVDVGAGDCTQAQLQDINAFNTWLRAYCTAQGIVCMDLNAAIADAAGQLPTAAHDGDGLHPNETGYNSLSPVVLPALRAAGYAE